MLKTFIEQKVGMLNMSSPHIMKILLHALFLKKAMKKVIDFDTKTGKISRD